MSGRLTAAAAAFALVLGSHAGNAGERGGGSHGRHVGTNRSHHSDGAVPRSPGTVAGVAERSHPRAGTGHGYGYYYHGRPYYRGSYSISFGWPYWYSPYWYGYGSYGPYWWDAPYYGGYGYRGYYRYRYRDEGSLRLQIEPDKARVYVDGYYAGIVDDFDGLFQKLHVPVGRHEILVRLEGYKEKRFRVYVPYDHTVKIHYHMVNGTGADTPEDLTGDDPGWDEEGSRAAREQQRRLEQEERERERGERDRDGGYDRPSERERGGSVRLEVRPDDASVYVDGEFEGTARELRRLDLPAGKHRIEVVRPGYRTVERDVEVKRGAPTSVEIELAR